MCRFSWQKIATSRIAKDEYGRVQCAWKHIGGHALLFLHRPRSRNASWSHRIGYWCLVCDDVLVKRKPAYGRKVRGVPWRWASQTLREYLETASGQMCHVSNGRRPRVSDSIRAMTVRFDELPPVLTGHHRHGERNVAPAGADDPTVPTALPMVPPERTLVGAFAHSVLSQEEFVLYVATWRQWTVVSSKTQHVDIRSSLATLCIAEVRLHRLSCLFNRGTNRIATRLYHATFLQRERVRHKLAATRRQHLMATGIIPDAA